MVLGKKKHPCPKLFWSAKETQACLGMKLLLQEKITKTVPHSHTLVWHRQAEWY